MYVFLLDIYAVEEVFVHKGVVAVFVVTGKVTVFIKIEGSDTFKTDFTVIVASYELVIGFYG